MVGKDKYLIGQKPRAQARRQAQQTGLVTSQTFFAPETSFNPVKPGLAEIY
jgi:hypothetical protein